MRTLGLLVLLVYSSIAMADTLIRPFLGQNLASLGEGYDEASDKFSSSCLTDFASKQVGSFYSKSYLNKPIDDLDIIQMLGVSPDEFLRDRFGRRWPFTSHLADMNFMDRSITLFYGFEVRGKFNAIDRRVVPSDCRDIYVDKVEYGGRVVVKLHIVFPTNFQLKRLRNSVNFNTVALENFFKVMDSSKSLVDSRRVKIYLSAKQSGGDAARLGEIFFNQGNLSMACTLDSLASCKEVGSSLYNYLTGRTGLIRQFHNHAPKDILSFHLRRLGLEDGRVRGQYRVYFTKEYRKLTKDERILSDLLSSPFLPIAEKQAIKKERAKIEYNISQLQSLAVYCLDSGNTCELEWGEYLNNIRDYSLDFLLQPLGLGEACHDREYSGSLSRTIDTLLLRTKTNRCVDLVEKSDSLVDLAIVEPGTYDLSPISYLTSLASLDLRDIEGISWGELAALKDLYELTVRNTNLSDISWISGFRKVELLDLRHNNIRIFPLDTFRRKAINTVKINGNPCENCDIINDSLETRMLWTSNTQSCNSLREELFRNGIIKSNIYELAAKWSFGPSLSTRYDSYSKIEGWYDCELVARWLP